MNTAIPMMKMMMIVMTVMSVCGRKWCSDDEGVMEMVVYMIVVGKKR